MIYKGENPYLRGQLAAEKDIGLPTLTVNPYLLHQEDLQMREAYREWSRGYANIANTLKVAEPVRRQPVGRPIGPEGEPLDSAGAAIPPVTANIIGYRQLSQAEQDLINAIKEAERGVLTLVKAIKQLQMEEQEALMLKSSKTFPASDFENEVASRGALQAQADAIGNAARWMALSKTSLQVGFMQMVRAVARPAE